MADQTVALVGPNLFPLLRLVALPHSVEIAQQNNIAVDLATG